MGQIAIKVGMWQQWTSNAKNRLTRALPDTADFVFAHICHTLGLLPKQPFQWYLWFETTGAFSCCYALVFRKCHVPLFMNSVSLLLLKELSVILTSFYNMNIKILTKKSYSKIKFHLIPIWRLQVMQDCVHWHCSIDYCVKLSLVDETLGENCSHFTLKWFLLNSFGEMCFLEESFK